METDVGVDAEQARARGRQVQALSIDFKQLVGQFQWAVQCAQDAAGEAPVAAAYDAYGSRYVTALDDVAQHAAIYGPAMGQSADDIEREDRANAEKFKGSTP